MRRYSLSPEKASKISAYIGFALKSRAVVMGVDYIRTAKGIELILADESLSPNSLKRLRRAADAAGTECVTMPVAEVFPISSVKALGIRNGELAKAIINTIESK